MNWSGRYDEQEAGLRTIGFVMEQTLGHVTHHQNLAHRMEDSIDLCPRWMPVLPHADDRWERMPGVSSNWSLKGSLRARDALREAERGGRPPDALFIHTQTLALFAMPWMRRIPTVISLDATPLNYDSVGTHYGHTSRGPALLERFKHAWNRRTFHECAALVTWCRWAKESLVNDYGVPADKVQVIPPGIDLARWHPASARVPKLSVPLRLLFVGGDFARKGGLTLLEALRGLPVGTCELDLVTRELPPPEMLAGQNNVRVHTGLTANSAPLRALFAEADLFVFPTLGDCLPLAVMEAMAAGLPVITTAVGALREEVEEGVSGLIVPPADAPALAAAIRTLAENPVLRATMGEAGLRLASERFDAVHNYDAVLDLLRSLCY